MEGFNAKVRIPPERAHESVFRFDGDKLNPNDTPEVRWQTSVGGGVRLPWCVDACARFVAINFPPKYNTLCVLFLFHAYMRLFVFVPFWAATSGRTSAEKEDGDGPVFETANHKTVRIRHGRTPCDEVRGAASVNRS